MSQIWPNIPGEQQKGAVSVVAASLNNLLGYPHGEEEAWQQYIKASYEEVESILEKALKLRN